MTTPEGRTKDAIRDLLDGYDGLWQYWPVPSGYGRKTVDVLGCFRGHFFAIEAKAEGEVPTQLQRDELNRVVDAGGTMFVIAGEKSPALKTLKMWLDDLKSMYPHDTRIAPVPSTRRPL